MKKLFVLVVVACSVMGAFAQLNDPKGYSKASRAYRDYRITATAPPYGLAKVRNLIKRTKEDEDGNVVISSKAFNALSTKEKFTYCMIHGEVFSQNCNGMPGVLDEEKKIFSHPASSFSEEDWSKRQEAWVKSHRRDVIALLRATIRARHRVGVNLKKAILDLDAYDLIPDLVAAYRPSNKDQDILSTLCVLMKDGSYPPFLKSATYRKLYGKDSSYQSFIMANAANQKLTIDRAMAFYRSRG